MPSVTVLYTTKIEPVKEKIEKELNWYDNIKQEMQVFSGGKLSFRYKEDTYLVNMGTEERSKRGISTTYRMLPVVEDLEVTNYNKVVNLSNKKEIEEWYSNYMNYYDANITVGSIHEEGIDFEVSNDEIEDFLEDCERNGFNYDRE